MSATLRLHDLAPSPNNIKVRIALNYKGIPFERIPVPFKGFPIRPEDRADLIRISGQPLAPVIEHDGRVIFDSGAILRYLESTFPDTPKIFSTDRETMKSIEEWEWFGRTECPEPVGMTLGQAMEPSPDHDVLERASRRIQEVSGRVEERLHGRKWLVGDSITAADMTIAPFLFYGMVPDAIASQGGAAAFFHEHLSLGTGRDITREWVGRVMAYDREPQPAT